MRRNDSRFTSQNWCTVRPLDFERVERVFRNERAIAASAPWDRERLLDSRRSILNRDQSAKRSICEGNTLRLNGDAGAPAHHVDVAGMLLIESACEIF